MRVFLGENSAGMVKGARHPSDKSRELETRATHGFVMARQLETGVALTNVSEQTDAMPRNGDPGEAVMGSWRIRYAGQVLVSSSWSNGFSLGQRKNATWCGATTGR